MEFTPTVFIQYLSLWAPNLGLKKDINSLSRRVFPLVSNRQIILKFFLILNASLFQVPSLPFVSFCSKSDCVWNLVQASDSFLEFMFLYLHSLKLNRTNYNYSNYLWMITSKNWLKGIVNTRLLKWLQLDSNPEPLSS